MFIPSPIKEGSTICVAHYNFTLSIGAETSKENQCRRQPEEISAQSTFETRRQHSLNMGEFRLAPENQTTTQ